MTQAAPPPPPHWDALRKRNRDGGLAKRVFTVVGNRTVHGKNKGETLEIELTRAQADALIVAGHLKEITPPGIVLTREVTPKRALITRNTK